MRSRYILVLLLLLLLPLLSCDSGGGESSPTAPGQDDGGSDFVDLSQIKFKLENAFPDLSFDRPVDLQSPADGTGRLFVAEQRGVIKVLFNSQGGAAQAKEFSESEVFLDIQDKVFFDENESGLLGFAFHPHLGNNGRFYVNYTADNPLRNVISSFAISPTDPNKADPESELIILEILQPHPVHNGGQLVFGPDDGYLYIAVGDGGPGGGAGGRAQDLTNLFGTVLRIDVDNPQGSRNYGIPPDNPFSGNNEGIREEIYAYGLRNVFRMSFDIATGKLWAGDVGEASREEIDIIEKGKNYGWPIMEGFSCFDPPSNCDETNLEKPIFDYGHRDNDRTIIGGFVYRGKSIPQLVGVYVYGDFISGRIWALQSDGVNDLRNTELGDFDDFCLVSFGIDENNDLYVVCFDGNIYTIVPETQGHR
ncbi:MAG: PQQ-dependent sugar dehydrogenase [Thermodesulfobacteriota bacterium]